MCVVLMKTFSRFLIRYYPNYFVGHKQSQSLSSAGYPKTEIGYKK